MLPLHIPRLARHAAVDASNNWRCRHREPNSRIASFLASSSSRDHMTTPLPFTAAKPCLLKTVSMVIAVADIHVSAHSSPTLDSPLPRERKVSYTLSLITTMQATVIGSASTTTTNLLAAATWTAATMPLPLAENTTGDASCHGFPPFSSCVEVAHLNTKPCGCRDQDHHSLIGAVWVSVVFFFACVR